MLDFAQQLKNKISHVTLDNVGGRVVRDSLPLELLSGFLCETSVPVMLVNTLVLVLSLFCF